MKMITQLHPVDQIDLDRAQLSTLYTQLGPVGAEDVVCRAMEELALRLSLCDRLHRAAHLVELRKNTRSLVAIAQQIGMSGVANVATDVTACIDAENHVGLAATMNRLMRTGEASLTAIWEMQDIQV